VKVSALNDPFLPLLSSWAFVQQAACSCPRGSDPAAYIIARCSQGLRKGSGRESEQTNTLTQRATDVQSSFEVRSPALTSTYRAAHRRTILESGRTPCRRAVLGLQWPKSEPSCCLQKFVGELEALVNRTKP
jgi:hypothetical protein